MAAAAATHRVDPEDLEYARQGVQQARQAIEVGALVRKAKAAKDAGALALDDAEAHSRRAKQLREAARSTDVVLSEAVAPACQALRVDSGRLVTDTARGVTFYADLSMGERWRLALDLAAAAVGRGGLLTCPQEAWESLDPQNRNAIAERCQELGVVLLSAEATGDELISAEMF